MKTPTTKRKAMILGSIAALAIAGTALAQAGLQIGGRTANFGRRELAPGFVPDPVSVAVTSGGNIDASTLSLGPDCVGFVTRQPDFILNLTGTSNDLRFYVTAGSDTTLVINGADGRWHCNDDSFGGTNPTVDIDRAGPGQYDVWIGSYRSNDPARGQLHITEVRSNHP